MRASPSVRDILEALWILPTWHCEVSIPDERSDWPILVIYELIDSSELGTEANPIVIGDDPAPFGSASNPIVIHVDEDCGHDEAEQLGSDADTEIMATPEFWEKLIDESLPAPADERADVNSVSVLPPTTQLACEDLEEPRIVEQNCPRLDDKAIKDRAPKVMEDHSVALYGQTSQAETDRNKYEDNNYPVCGVPDTISITDQSQAQETPHSTTKCIASEPPHGSYGRWSAKRKLSDADGVSLEPRRSERLIKRARQSVPRM
ncbi:hypothetical protein PDIP_88570 [Penicillium digitatum Pd1]|uniref:Uncharacterized protein n=1 Tax=Penicillium digitatum (strain Pd1 / CECT 20795) TaxID=1170230 RepID=K9FMY0_PEND1|nr:hypothetical protein PDIP_88570 [Penicillium digitatum Pd1]EKV04138.1 hypothetical protein PDIP_88570 [Penicillium digitatum Pd1]